MFILYLKCILVYDILLLYTNVIVRVRYTRGGFPPGISKKVMKGVIMSRYRDINKLTKEDLFYESYSYILRLLKDLVNTNDIDHAKFLKFELELQIKYFCKCKIRLFNERNI